MVKNDSINSCEQSDRDVKCAPLDWPNGPKGSGYAGKPGHEATKQEQGNCEKVAWPPSLPNNVTKPCESKFLQVGTSNYSTSATATRSQSFALFLSLSSPPSSFIFSVLVTATFAPQSTFALTLSLLAYWHLKKPRLGLRKQSSTCHRVSSFSSPEAERPALMNHRSASRNCIPGPHSWGSSAHATRCNWWCCRQKPNQSILLSPGRHLRHPRRSSYFQMDFLEYMR